MLNSSVINMQRDLLTSSDDINEFEPQIKKGPGAALYLASVGPEQHVVPSLSTISKSNVLSAVPDTDDDGYLLSNCNDNTNSKFNPASIIADKYIILDPIEESSSLHQCVNVHTSEKYVCKIACRQTSSSLLLAHHLLDCQPHINSPQEVLLGDKMVYMLFPPSFGDLHSYVRHYKRLRESEARRLFRQMAETVRACHRSCVVLRDLKLRKFVFVDSERTELKLETLEDAVVFQNGDDCLQDKRGCPAYVSPEILRSHARYSGRAADIWSLGVILYAMLVGRYPFSDTEHVSLFAKISRGHFVIPEGLSPRAKCLIRSLLRKNPEERLTAEDLLIHPWLSKEDDSHSPTTSSADADQTVPELP